MVLLDRDTRHLFLKDLSDQLSGPFQTIIGTDAHLLLTLAMKTPREMLVNLLNSRYISTYRNYVTATPYLHGNQSQFLTSSQYFLLLPASPLIWAAHQFKTTEMQQSLNISCVESKNVAVTLVVVLVRDINPILPLGL